MCTEHIAEKKLVSVFLKVGNGVARAMVLELLSIQLEGITGFPASIPAREPSSDGLAGVFTKRTVVWPFWGLGHGQQIKGVSFLIKFELMTSYLIGFK